MTLRDLPNTTPQFLKTILISEFLQSPAKIKLGYIMCFVLHDFGNSVSKWSENELSSNKGNLIRFFYPDCIKTFVHGIMFSQYERIRKCLSTSGILRWKQSKIWIIDHGWGLENGYRLGKLAVDERNPYGPRFFNPTKCGLKVRIS